MTSANTRRVVITGMGTINPIGRDVPTSWKNLTEGVSGIDKLSIFNPYDFKMEAKIAGEIKDFKLEEYFSTEKADSMRKDMDRVSQFSMVAAKEAMVNSGLDQALAAGSLDRQEVNVFVGTGIGGITTTSDDIYKLIQFGPKKVGVRSIIRLMPNAPAGQIGIEFGLKGQAKSESTACASGLDALLDAYYNIVAGLSQAAVVGGSEACLMPLAVSSFYNMRALSRRDVPPAEACCPFSAERDGFVISEGAAMFVIEEREQAIKRGAPILAEIVGAAATCDAYHITAPHETGEGAARAMNKALERAQINPEQLQYIHAHGTSTPLNDERETRAIKTSFGDHAYKLWISSSKSMTGHMIGAAGPMGVMASVQALQTKIVPATINFNKPDPECDLDYVPNTAREMKDLTFAMVNSLGFGGHNTSLVLKAV